MTLSNLTLNGTLNLPALATINVGGNLLLHADTNFNFFSGLYAGRMTTVGINNTGIGFQALLSNVSGDDNTASGAAALVSNNSGGGNTTDGIAPLLRELQRQFQHGPDGSYALSSSTTANNNTAVGFGALKDLCSVYGPGGSNNVAIGYLAGTAFIGNESSNIDIGNMGVTGESGVIRIGTPGSQTAAYIAGSLTVYGTLNLPATPVTINSGTNLLLDADTNFNFFSGPNAGNLTTFGIGNTAQGDYALNANTSGFGNTAIGAQALQVNASGYNNTASGSAALSGKHEWFRKHSRRRRGSHP